MFSVISLTDWMGVISLSEINLATIQLKGKKQDFVLSEKDFKTGS